MTPTNSVVHHDSRAAQLVEEAVDDFVEHWVGRAVLTFLSSRMSDELLVDVVAGDAIHPLLSEQKTMASASMSVDVHSRPD